MPIGKEMWRIPCRQRTNPPDCNGVQSGDSSFLFIVAKRPLGYLLPLSCLSSHLLMRWQTTPAATVTRNVKNNSMQPPPPVAGCRLDNTGIITYRQILFYHFWEELYLVSNLIQIGILIVALVNLLYQIYKKKLPPLFAVVTAYFV